MTFAYGKAVKRKERMRFLKICSINWKTKWKQAAIIFTGILWIAVAGTVAAAGVPGPVWKVGRAVVESRQAMPPGALTLKLSLRNEGAAGSVPVQIFGRWVLQPMPPQYPYALLGSYMQEVALKQTAILEMPLTPLQRAPPGKPVIEVVVTTGGIETDRKWVRVE